MAHSHVTKREAQAVCDYAADLMAVMRMPSWKVLVMEEPADEDEQASVNWIDQRYVAQLYLSRDWMKLDSDTRREVITHEVLHLLHCRVSTAAFDDSRGLMHDHEHDDWSRRVRREFELMVDHLASFMTATHTLQQAWAAAHKA